MIRTVLQLIITLGFLQGYSQGNLVDNGSFERKSYCPSNFNQQQLKNVEMWYQPTEGTPDYFNACSDKVGVPKNMFGNEPAHDGEGYIGVVTFSPGKRNYREYIQTKLTRNLSAGELVCVQMRVSAADKSKYVTDGIGLALTKEKLASSRSETLPQDAALENPRLHMLDQADGWVLLSNLYEAKGGEQFLTIGNFKSDIELKVIKRTREMGATEVSQWSYVYIDDVVIRPVKKPEDCHCTIPDLAAGVHDPPLELEEYEQIKLDAILFDFDKDELTEEGDIQLKEVYRLLNKNSHMYMEIIGHADIMGNDTYNIDLSKRRATRVIAYLNSKGIAESRLKIAFFGSTKPIADNTTEEGRQQNRRVEFQVLEKKFELVQ